MASEPPGSGAFRCARARCHSSGPNRARQPILKLGSTMGCADGPHAAKGYDMTNRYKPNEPTCPVSIELLSLLLRSSDERVAEIAREIPALQRATLATHCVARTHLRRIALLVAVECSEHALWEVAGPAGVALFEQSRDQGAFDREPGLPSKRKVSLAKVA